MKNLTRFVSGLAASLLLAAGLQAAAERIDPMTQDADLKKPDNTTTDQGKVSALPCTPCAFDE